MQNTAIKAVLSETDSAFCISALWWKKKFTCNLKFVTSSEIKIPKWPLWDLVLSPEFHFPFMFGNIAAAKFMSHNFIKVRGTKAELHLHSQAIWCHCCWQRKNNTGVAAKNNTTVYLPLLELKNWYTQWSGAAVCFLSMLSLLFPSNFSVHFFFFTLLLYLRQFQQTVRKFICKSSHCSSM